MKIIHAGNTGSLVRQFPGKLRVLSVYSGAVNLLHSKGLLISLVRSMDQMSALSICIPDIFSVGGIVTDSIEPGLEFELTGDMLKSERITVVPENARLFNGFLCIEEKVFLPDTHEFIRQLLLKYGKRGGLLGIIDKDTELNIFERKALTVLETLFPKDMGKLQKELPVKIRGLSELIGLGIGFTPSGDDFIAGVILGEELTGDRGHNCPLIDRDEIMGALHKTGYGGRTLLWQVLKNRFPFYMIKLADGLLTGVPDEMEKAVCRAVSHGETSGTDLLTGLIYAVLQRVKWS
ncbi:MAG: DUF2877 domain-containing protein [Spirochaetes bacterium]|nr:DUF2877 domain-containing protein [Spirochaetota bacterium]